MQQSQNIIHLFDPAASIFRDAARGFHADPQTARPWVFGPGLKLANNGIVLNT
jgi:hypothetical protein